jgi:hypothetical protein
MDFLRKKFGFAYVRQSGKLSMTEHFNACLTLPSSRWLWMVHDDDELCPDSVGKVESFLAGCEDVGIVVGGVQYIDQQGKILQQWIPKTKRIFRGEEGLVRLGLDFPGLSPITIFSVSASRQIGGFVNVKGAAADYTFALRLAYCCGVAFLPELVGRYRLGRHRSTDFSTPEKAGAWIDFTAGMAEEVIRTVDCSDRVAARIIDYMTWGEFLMVAPFFSKFSRFFVYRLKQKCLGLSPRRGKWQNRVRREYPLLFFRPQWLVWPLFKTAKLVLPAPVRRWLRQIILIQT